MCSFSSLFFFFKMTLTVNLCQMFRDMLNLIFRVCGDGHVRWMPDPFSMAPVVSLSKKT